MDDLSPSDLKSVFTPMMLIHAILLSVGEGCTGKL